MRRSLPTILCILVFLVACLMVNEYVVYGQLPEIEAAVEVRLVASPFQPSSYLPCKPIPAGGQVCVLGTESNGAMLLVLHENMLGWIPAMFSATSIGTLKLPLVKQPPLGDCATYLDAELAPNGKWQSSVSGPVLAQGLLYRPAARPGSPHISIAVEIDGGGWVSASQIDRISLGGSGEIIPFIFNLEDVKPDSQVGFLVSGGDGEPLAFQAAFYRNDCTEGTPTPPPSAPTPTPTSTTIVHETGPTPGPSSTAKPTPTSSPTTECQRRPRSAFQPIWSQYRAELGCAAESWQSDMVVQQFERGEMIWMKSPPGIYVLYDSRIWKMYDDIKGPDDPPCAEAANTGGRGPVRGFGVVWCDFERVPLGDPKNVERASQGIDGVPEVVQQFQGGIAFTLGTSGRVLLDAGRWQPF